MTLEHFKLHKQHMEDPHAQAKARIHSQIKSAYGQKRLERLKDLALFVKRAFDLAVATGEIVIGRDRDELGDDGMVCFFLLMSRFLTATFLRLCPPADFTLCFALSTPFASSPSASSPPSITKYRLEAHDSVWKRMNLFGVHDSACKHVTQNLDK